MKTKKKAISLIVLVITIIVLSVLAATVVLTITNSGLINTAKDTTNSATKKQVEEIANLAWADAYVNGLRTQAELEDAVIEALEGVAGYDSSKYEITVTTNGVTVEYNDGYYSGLDVVPTKAEYFTFDYDTENLTATLTGISTTYAEVTYYDGTAVPIGILDEDGQSITDIVVPYSVTDENGVEYTVTAIGESAFGTELGVTTYPKYTSVILPETITSIGADAFNSCRSLTSITIQEGVTRIGDYAFLYCNSLESVTIPSGVASIAGYAFCYCESLTSVTIPRGVTSIGVAAFEECESLLAINYGGTTTEWTDDSITFGNQWNAYTGDYTVYCTDGTVSKDGTVTLN